MKRKRTSIYIREDLIEKAKRAAAEENRTYNNYIENLIDQDTKKKADKETSQ